MCWRSREISGEGPAENDESRATLNQPDAVMVCGRPGVGTGLNRTEADRLARRLDEYRLGDLWAMGETGANP